MVSKDEDEEETGMSNNSSYQTQTHIPILMCWELRLITFMRTVLRHPELNNTYSEGICALRRKSEQKVLLEKGSRESIQITDTLLVPIIHKAFCWAPGIVIRITGNQAITAL